MDEITSEWLVKKLAEHPGDERGKKAALAQALGLGADKVSKMLKGTRKPQAGEIPAIMAFFGVASPTVDPELLAVWQQLEPSERVFLLNAAKAQVAARASLPPESSEDS